MLQINGVYPTDFDDAEDVAAANAYNANLTGTVIVNDDAPDGGFNLFN